MDNSNSARTRNKLKVGILLVGIGKYIQFMDSIVDLARKNFLPNCEKTFYIFTDQPNNSIKDLGEDIVTIYQQNLGWPLNAMWRNKIFTLDKNWNILKENDYLFFFNADSLVVNKITEEEFLPIEDAKPLIAVRHSVHTTLNYDLLPFEKNPESSCFIDKESQCLGYFVSGIWGGKTNAFYEACHEITDLLIKDLVDKAIIPQWHDESAFNFIVNKSPERFKILGRQYCFSIEDVTPEEGEEIKIAIRPKYLVGGRFVLRSLNPQDLAYYVYNDSACKEIVELEYKDGSKERLKISKDGKKAFRCKWLQEVDLINTNYKSIAFRTPDSNNVIEFLPAGHKTYKEYE